MRSPRDFTGARADHAAMIAKLIEMHVMRRTERDAC
jgi:hypothetical protein